MSNGAFVAGMLAWRRALRLRHPEIAAAVAAEWGQWLQLQRQEPPDVSKPLLIVHAQLSCLDDANAQIGLAQMLAFADVRCAVIFSFPTAAMTSIARAEARRNGWEGLIEMADISSSERLIERLPGDSALLSFSAPAVLGRTLIENQLAQRHYAELSTPLSDKDGAGDSLLAGKAFLGRARDYAGWRDQQGEPDWPSLIQTLDKLGATAEDFGISASPIRQAKRKAWPDADGSLDAAAAPADELSVPEVGIGDELVVRTSREPFHSNVVERRPARLLDAAGPFSIRMPGAMLGPAPRILRVEAHKPDGEVLASKVLVHVKPSQLEPWMITCFLNRGGGGNPVIRAFAGSIGARLAYAEDEPSILQDIPVVWGVLRDSDRILEQAKAQAVYFFYVDHAYFNRGHRRSYRITRNGYEAGAIRRCPDDRAEELEIETRPWRRSGKEIIVCPPTEYFIQAHGCPDWLEKTLETLKSVTDRPIIVREKPAAGEAAVPLPVALEDAHALVAHSSNVAIEAVCLGTPVFVAPTSAAAPIGRTDLSMIEDPVYPDREPWLAHLAYNQFSFDEIQDGRAWKMLLELEEREFA
jgi:hypothetical protein